MKRILCASLLCFIGCTAGWDDPGSEVTEPATASGATPVGAEPTPTATPTELFTGEQNVIELAGGQASGQWCGSYRVTGEVQVPPGALLELCAGTVVAFNPGVSLKVEGTLRSLGVQGRPAVLSADSSWAGVQVSGQLDGAFLRIERATLCVDGVAGSRIDLSDSALVDCSAGSRFASGVTLTRSEILGGSTVYMTGGRSQMIDTLLDLRHPTVSPDCTNVSGGGLVLEHVRFTGCHCPLHISAAPEGVSVNASVFDGAAVPMMIANTTNATFAGSHFLSSGAQIQDIGGGIHAHVAANYWGGGAPVISTSNPSQFTGTDSYFSEPIAEVGPR